MCKSEWASIETAPKDGTPVFLAHIRNGDVVWAALAEYGTAMPGYMHCASYSGWFPRQAPLCDPVNRLGEHVPDGIIGGQSMPPTHWMPLPEPPQKDEPR